MSKRGASILAAVVSGLLFTLFLHEAGENAPHHRSPTRSSGREKSAPPESTPRPPLPPPFAVTHPHPTLESRTKPRVHGSLSDDDGLAANVHFFMDGGWPLVDIRRIAGSPSARGELETLWSEVCGEVDRARSQRLTIAEPILDDLIDRGFSSPRGDHTPPRHVPGTVVFTRGRVTLGAHERYDVRISLGEYPEFDAAHQAYQQVRADGRVRLARFLQARR